MVVFNRRFKKEPHIPNNAIYGRMRTFKLLFDCFFWYRISIAGQQGMQGINSVELIQDNKTMLI